MIYDFYALLFTALPILYFRARVKHNWKEKSKKKNYKWNAQFKFFYYYFDCCCCRYCPALDVVVVVVAVL